MSEALDVRFRNATPADARAVAARHADSWRRHYRGAYSDSFLDGDVHMALSAEAMREHAPGSGMWPRPEVLIAARQARGGAFPRMDA